MQQTGILSAAPATYAHALRFIQKLGYNNKSLSQNDFTFYFVLG